MTPNGELAAHLDAVLAATAAQLDAARSLRPVALREATEARADAVFALTVALDGVDLDDPVLKELLGPRARELKRAEVRVANVSRMVLAALDRARPRRPNRAVTYGRHGLLSG